MRVTTQTVLYIGIPRVPLSKKLNPIWWFGSETEQQLSEASWYRPEWPLWRREFYWTYLRNPPQNLRAVVLGIKDKSYTVTGRAPVWTVQRNDLNPPETGWQWHVLYGGELWVPRFFVSYSGKRLVWYAGWQPSGFFGAKLNIRGIIQANCSAGFRAAPPPRDP